jgi:hypothetical protein
MLPSPNNQHSAHTALGLCQTCSVREQQSCDHVFARILFHQGLTVHTHAQVNCAETSPVRAEDMDLLMERTFWPSLWYMQPRRSVLNLIVGKPSTITIQALEQVSNSTA